MRQYAAQGGGNRRPRLRGWQSSSVTDSGGKRQRAADGVGAVFAEVDAGRYGRSAVMVDTGGGRRLMRGSSRERPRQVHDSSRGGHL